ncbi:hypothetical protein L7F22_014286 [Adiantum nelumboides]|nr:hypothetical protein [Adiantum nelumboides]
MAAVPCKYTEEVFAEHANGKDYMDVADFTIFLVSEQGEYHATEEYAASLICQFYEVSQIQPRLGSDCFTIHEFCLFLSSPQLNSLMQISAKPTHDMTAPLSHYFISSSHNSYLTGNQLTSSSGTAVIEKALKAGCRVIELDCWEREGEIMVLHGHTLTTPVRFDECLRAIKENAFLTTDYPVIVTIENHLPVDLQIEAARMIRDILDEFLFVPSPDERPPRFFASPEQLKHKIVISDTPFKEPLPEQVLTDPKGMVDTFPYLVPNPPGLEEDDSPPLSPNTITGDAKRRILRRIGHAADTFFHRGEYSNQENEETRRADKLEELIYIFSEKLIQTGDDSPPGLPLSGDNSIMANLSEPQLRKLAKQDATSLIRYTHNNLGRMYPFGLRLNSSNPNPYLAWAHGFQLAALNIQGQDRPCWISQALFNGNGKCGFVKKPPILLPTSHGMQFENIADILPKLLLKVRILTGFECHKAHTFSRSRSLYTKVAIDGYPPDKAKERTDAIPHDDGDAQPPNWEHQFFKFVIRGGLVFQSMAGYALENQQYMPRTVVGVMQDMVPNPMYANIGWQPGFQGTQGGFWVSQGNLGMSGHDGIWTIIDRFSKQAYFVPVKKTVKPDHLARLFVAQIFRLHGMPETIVSDRDPRFTSLFWKAIWENIGMRLQFSSSFHPQTDGQSEIANSVVLDLLKSYISDQKTQWKRCLPLVEFAYNNTIHSSTGKAPFEIVEGVRKVPPFLSTKDKILEANEYTRDLDTDFAKVRETLQKSQERQKKAADLHRHDSKLKENDWVLLRFDKARLRQKKGKEELSMRYYGPFQITKQINDISFRLRLPDTWKIHNVFHVNLWKTFGDVPDDGEPDEQPEVEANEEILVPEQEVLQASKTPTQTQKASSQSLQSPRQSRSDHLQRRETSKEHRSNEAKGKGHVVEQPPASIGHRQPYTHGLVNGQDSNEQTMRQTISMPMSNAGCFGGGSVFQAMIRPSPALHGFMPDNAYGAMQAGSSNPMYGNIGVQPGFQCAAGSYGMPGANMGMVGFSQPNAQNLNMAGRPGGNFGSGMPLLNAPAYDNLLTSKGKPNDYKGDKQSSLTPSMEHMTN